MGAVVVVDVDERVELVLELGECGCSQLGVQPFLHRLLEALDLAARRGMIRPGVLLADPELHEFVLESARFDRRERSGW